MGSVLWSDIVKGDRVVVAGKTYEVDKIKPKGKKLAVRMRLGGQAFDGVVKPRDAVERAPLRNAENGQARWATKAEHEAAQPRRTKLEAGDALQTRRPYEPIGDVWETPRDRVERKLDTILGAVLVAETLDESAGYYVPPVDVTTIAAHLALFHGVDPSQFGIDDMVEVHALHHEAALKGVALEVNHWHTKTRPAIEA